LPTGLVEEALRCQMPLEHIGVLTVEEFEQA
jgi:hypothetical protein